MFVSDIIQCCRQSSGTIHPIEPKDEPVEPVVEIAKAQTAPEHIKVDETLVETSEGESTDSDTQPNDSDGEEEDVQPQRLFEPQAVTIPKSTTTLQFRIFALHRDTIEDIKTKIQQLCKQESTTMCIHGLDYSDIIKRLSDAEVNIFTGFFHDKIERNVSLYR